MKLKATLLLLGIGLAVVGPAAHTAYAQTICTGGQVAVSQQFGLNQTDVFQVGPNGQLDVFWVDNAGAWQGPQTIGPAGIAIPCETYLAASRQFGLNQTDVFLVDTNGQLNVFWVDNAGAWRGPQKIGTPGITNPGSPIAASQQFGLNQTDVFLVDKSGSLDVFWVDDGGAWRGPEKIGSEWFAQPGSFIAASQQFGLNQTDVFLVDESGSLDVFWVDDGGEWKGPQKIGPSGIAYPGFPIAASQQFGLNQTDVFLVDESGSLDVFWVDSGGAWRGPQKIGPSGIAGLGSFVAASQQFGLSQTDVFVFDQNAQLNVFWVDDAGAWQGPEEIGAELSADPCFPMAASRQFGLNQTDVFLMDGQTGKLSVFWVDNAGAWKGPLAIN